ncbi:dapper homolog 2 [Labrus mixtus]|uniref:dapper homolog 2 n=1 Tax=Labrus mixtus TaxID=508554 RepID=UPI0029C0B4E0|nr:dapper homolog 2 [Labrus mixtus]
MLSIEKPCAGPSTPRPGLNTPGHSLKAPGRGLNTCGPGLTRSGPGFGSGLMSAGAGAESCGLRERLRAALAGLTELKLLKDRQRELVNRALRDRDEPGPAVCEEPEEPERTGRTETEERLEATLTALKQQLSRLRKKDVGLKSHLQQLGQQISELTMDVRRASMEQQEGDSRPSSGFYELSDGSSLSNSCTSVYSESLTSSQTSLLRPLSPPCKPEVLRRRSADENSVRPHPPWISGLHLGSSRIRASPSDPAQNRRLSTGDLELVLVQGLSCYKPSTDLKTCTVDPKFQNDLLSSSGMEIYQYPSPLHAVALQSPVFFQVGGTASPGPLEGQGPQGSSSVTPRKELPGPETGTLGCIDRVLLSRRLQSEAQTLRDQYRKSFEDLTVCPEAYQTQSTNLGPPQMDQKRPCMMKSVPQPPPSVRPPKVSNCYSSPPAFREPGCDEVCSSSLTKVKGGPLGRQELEDHEDSMAQKQVQRQRFELNGQTSSEETPSAPSQFVLAKFVPAGSQSVRVRPADRKTRSLKLRKPRAPRTKETRSKGDQRSSGKVTQKTSEELRPGFSSDTSPCNPGLPYTNKVQVKSLPFPAVLRSRKVRRPHSPAHDWSEDQRRPEELIQNSSWSRDSQVQMLQGARLGQWTGPSGSFLSSVPSVLHGLNPRYPPALVYRSSLNPPRCMSEYSAECDHTVNHYGDCESSFGSSSKSDSSLSLDQDQEDQPQHHSGLVWSLQQLPEPFACRIKASRALKKKIRRFQPSSLKVMTLV